MTEEEFKIKEKQAKEIMRKAIRDINDLGIAISYDWGAYLNDEYLYPPLSFEDMET